MTARERIIETAVRAIDECPSPGSMSGPEWNAYLCGVAFDAIPPSLLWEWLIETGKIEQVGFYLDEYGFEGMKHGLEGPENSGVPVFRLVPEK